MTSRGLYDVEEIKRLLRDRIMSLLNELYHPSARDTKGNRLFLGDVFGAEGKSCIINIRPVKGFLPGDWNDFESGKGGDVLALIGARMGHADFRETLTFARKFLGIDELTAEDKKQWRMRQDELEKRERKARADALAEADKRKRAAGALFFAARDIAGTPVESYLRDTRNIDVSKLPSTGACRFSPDCLDASTGELLPAMILCVTGPDGKFAGVQRTYLECVDGKWKAIKRPDAKGRMRSLKLSLGDIQGGHVSVSKGRAECPLGRAPAGDAVIICEGYETACVYAEAAPHMRVIAVLSLNNMKGVVMPATVTTRILVKENGLKPGGLAQFDAALATHQKQCADVRVIVTEAGYSDDDDFMMDDGDGEAGT